MSCTMDSCKASAVYSRLDENPTQLPMLQQSFPRRHKYNTTNSSMTTRSMTRNAKIVPMKTEIKDVENLKFPKLSDHLDWYDTNKHKRTNIYSRNSNNFSKGRHGAIHLQQQKRRLLLRGLDPLRHSRTPHRTKRIESNKLPAVNKTHTMLVTTPDTSVQTQDIPTITLRPPTVHMTVNSLNDKPENKAPELTLPIKTSYRHKRYAALGDNANESNSGFDAFASISPKEFKFDDKATSCIVERINTTDGVKDGNYCNEYNNIKKQKQGNHGTINVDDGNYCNVAYRSVKKGKQRKLGELVSSLDRQGYSTRQSSLDMRFEQSM
ncbi:unnamed protein product [Owenia fusiformis]|uniref:Uncharacterized protein n=1 Tax=Owenia fusiformis TaxID=6347 RepID=A0A8J1U5B2_OWEFU|nr:unnamed protein product [Owenia fusiformis]